MKPFRLLTVLTAVILLGWTTGCDNDKGSVNESKVLLTYLETEGGDYINTSAPSIMSAADIQAGLAASANFYIIDMRSATDFAAGRISGAVNVAMANLRIHMESINPASYERVIITCYSGQTAAYATALMRLMGHSNVYSMKWGMSSWNTVFAANSWSAKTSNGRAASFVTTDFPKAAPTDLPVISTGYKKAEDILAARVDELLAAGFSPALISESSVYANLTGYYIVNYWTNAHYLNPGHIDGAINYVPKQDLKSTEALLTLPTNKPVVVYCYTGQTSAYVTAYLRLLGYDARSLAYGANAMIYDVMNGMTGFTTFKETEIMNYAYVTG